MVVLVLVGVVLGFGLLVAMFYGIAQEQGDKDAATVWRTPEEWRRRAARAERRQRSPGGGSTFLSPEPSRLEARVVARREVGPVPPILGGVGISGKAKGTGAGVAVLAKGQSKELVMPDAALDLAALERTHRRLTYSDASIDCAWCGYEWPCETMELVARIRALEAQAGQLQHMLHDLTPGGSEFIDNPKRCHDWVQERTSKHYEWVTKQQHCTRELEATVAAQQARLGRLETALRFYADLDAYYDEYGHTDFAAGDAGAHARAALAPDARGGP